MTKRSLNKTDTANSLTRKSLVQFAKVSQTELRPYIWWVPRKTRTYIPKVGSYDLEGCMKNFGRTPAFDVDVDTWEHIDTSFNTKDFVGSKEVLTIGTPPITPGDTGFFGMTSNTGIKTDQKRLDSINSEKEYLFVAYRFTYSQHLGDSSIFWVSTCYLYYSVPERSL